MRYDEHVVPCGGPDQYLAKMYQTQESFVSARAIESLLIVDRHGWPDEVGAVTIDISAKNPSIWQDQLLEFARWVDDFCPSNPELPAKIQD